MRAERARRDLAKDALRAKELAPFVKAVAALGKHRTGGHGAPLQEEAVQNLRWLVEEFRVSLFAQELGTAEPVSAVRLERALQERIALDRADPPSGGPEQAGAAARPAVAPATRAARGAPLKSLGALDQLFRP
jgi:ATP-dependent helicase HrpA